MTIGKAPYAGIAIIVLLVIGALGYYGYTLFLFNSVAAKIPQEGTTVGFLKAGVTETYVMKNKVLVHELNALGDGVIIKESVQSPLSATDKIVLATAPGYNGIIAGVLGADNVLHLLMTGGTNKAGLVARKDGVIVFAASPVITVASAESSGTNDAAVSSEPEEHGSADGPVVLGTTTQKASKVANGPMLYSVNIKTKKILPLGEGRNPRLISDGSILALAPEGVVRIDPVARTRVLVLKSQGGNPEFGDLSPTGTKVALPGDGASFEFFTLSGSEPQHIGFIDPKGRPTRLTFLNEERFFIDVDDVTVRLYDLPTEKVQTASPVALLALTD